MILRKSALMGIHTRVIRVGIGVSCRSASNKVPLKLSTMIKFSFNLTLTSDSKTWVDEPWQKLQVHKTYANCSPHN